MFNNAFDILNMRNQFAKRAIYKISLMDENCNELKAHADEHYNTSAILKLYKTY